MDILTRQKRKTRDLIAMCLNVFWATGIDEEQISSAVFRKKISIGSYVRIYPENDVASPNYAADDFFGKTLSLVHREGVQKLLEYYKEVRGVRYRPIRDTNQKLTNNAWLQGQYFVNRGYQLFNRSCTAAHVPAFWSSAKKYIPLISTI